MADDTDVEGWRAALGAALAASGMSQRALGEAVGIPASTAQSRVSAWLNGERHPPSPAMVVALERTLGLAPGALTLHLGFLPPDARREVRSVTEAIDADPLLDERARRALRNLYATLAESPESRAS